MVANVLLLVTITVLQCCTTATQLEAGQFPECEKVGGSCEVSCPDGFELPRPPCSGDKVCCRKSVNLPLEIFSQRLANSDNRKRQCRPSRPCRKAAGTCISGGNVCSTLVKDGLCKGSCKCCLKDNCKSKKGKKGCTKKGGECKLRAVGCDGTQTETTGCKKNKKCVCCLGPPGTTPAPPEHRPYCENCGISTIDTTRIVGGQETEIGEYPWQVLVILINPGGDSQSLCGASLIKAKWVLTAAHCFETAFDGMLVSIGDHDSSSATDADSLTFLYSKEEYQDYIITHPDYNNPIPQNNDIAVIELKEAITFTDSIKPICLGFSKDQVVGSQVVVTGWGFTDYMANDVSNVLMEVALDLISVEECTTKYQNTPQPYSISNETMICALTPHKDACLGDSGGPLIHEIADGRWVQIGIISFAFQCAFKDAPGVYTNVAIYHDWIDNVTGSDQC